jgi:hypothetical protein
MLSRHDTSVDEEDPDNVNGTVEIQDVLGALEFDYQSTKDYVNRVIMTHSLQYLLQWQSVNSL